MHIHMRIKLKNVKFIRFFTIKYILGLLIIDQEIIIDTFTLQIYVGPQKMQSKYGKIIHIVKWLSNTINQQSYNPC